MQYWVYKLFYKGKLLYIGQTVRLEQRLKEHSRDKVFDEYSITICDTKTEMHQLENICIYNELPPLNRKISYVSLLEGLAVVALEHHMWLSNPCDSTSLHGLSSQENRKLKGKLLNLITKDECKNLLVSWAEGGYSNLIKYLKKVKDAGGCKEEDWVTGIAKSKGFSYELICAYKELVYEDKLHYLKYGGEELIVDVLTEYKTFSYRLRRLSQYFKKLEKIEEKNAIIEKLEQQLAQKHSTWQENALGLLSNGMTQKRVAVIVGKGTATISRLVKANK